MALTKRFTIVGAGVVALGLASILDNPAPTRDRIRNAGDLTGDVVVEAKEVVKSATSPSDSTTTTAPAVGGGRS